MQFTRTHFARVNYVTGFNLMKRYENMCGCFAAKSCAPEIYINKYEVLTE